MSIIDIDYTIDGGNVKLTDVDTKYHCGQCENVVALNNNGTILVKSFVSVVDHKHRKMVLRCGRCKSYNEIVEIGSENEACRLAV